MNLRNGIFYRPEDLQERNLEVIDDNLVRHQGMHRLPCKDKTAFQKFLVDLSENNYEIKDNDLQTLADKLFQDFISKTPVGINSIKDEEIIAACNDNSKRYFETLFAKNILIGLLENKDLPLLVKELNAFLKKQYELSELPYLKEWQSAKNEMKVNDDSLHFFSRMRPDLKKLYQYNHFGSKTDLLLEAYDLHYLTHRIRQLHSYKNIIKKGILEIYPRYQFFKKINRGRIYNFSFPIGLESYNLGILRSIDQSTYDVRKDEILNNETRCPDRLYVEHPQVTRPNNNNWHHLCFSNTVSDSYVNGLSGSILLEIRLILFFILSISKKQYQPQFVLNPLENINLIKNYFLFMTTMFIYFEGGHTFNEILNVFYIPKTMQVINEILHISDKDFFSLPVLIASNVIIKQAFQSALIDSAKFYDCLTKKGKMHLELKKVRAHP